MKPVTSSGATSRRGKNAVSEGTKRLKLTLAYDGQPWMGWQSLSNGRGVQDQVQRAFLKATGQTTRLYGSGRTDAGVHALAQVAHVDVDATLKLTGEAWMNALNACLPPSIRVIGCEDAPPTFHARFDTTGKIYRYRVWRPRILDPFEAGRAWHVHGPLDETLLHECARLVKGTHNFSRLSANRGDISDEERREDEVRVTRTITRADITAMENVIEIEYEGDGFLYKMARMITGSMVHVARGRETVEWFRSLVDDPVGLKTSQSAPADGLYLVRVLY
jgi:tRNA pseudouridine38-40 synthase